MREPRRMRRFQAECGAEYDEIPCGLIRLRLEHGDPRPIPQPQTVSAVVAEVGPLREMTARGYYDELAFELAADTTVGAMLAAAKSAVGKTFQGWKGGDYVMDLDTPVWLAQRGDSGGETLGRVMLSLMLPELAAGKVQQPEQPQSIANTPPSPVTRAAGIGHVVGPPGPLNVFQPPPDAGYAAGVSAGYAAGYRHAKEGR